MGTQQWLRGSGYFGWGVAVLVAVLGLVLFGNYALLERLQLIIVGLMLLCVVISLLLVKPSWFELLKGLFLPQRPEYPSWIGEHPEISRRPFWVEIITYVGVLGGSAYDYLAYVSYLRAKHWGRAGQVIADSAMLDEMARNPDHLTRRWLRALWIDSLLSFLAVLIFSGVFVACGAIVLGPQHKVPGGANLLQLQAEFISPNYPWLQPLYFVGAFLTIFGTLYGTIEVAPAILREMAEAVRPGSAEKYAAPLRRWAVIWSGAGGLVVLLWTWVSYLTSGAENPPGLIAVLTPINLFTGVFACGVICLLSWWMDRRCLPRGLHMAWPLQLLNLVATVVFLWLGIKAYWNHSRGTAFIILAGTLAVGWFVASATRAFASARAN